MKRRKFAHRVAALAGAALVLAVCLITCFPSPAAAITSGADPVYFPLHFDNYSIGSGSSGESGAWEGNTFNADQIWNTPVIDGPLYDFSQSKENASLDFSFTGHASFNLTSNAPQYLTADSLESVQIMLWDWDYDQSFMYELNIFFDYVAPMVVNDHWVFRSFSLSVNVMLRSEELYDIGSLMLSEIRRFGDKDWICISNLNFEFEVLESPGNVLGPPTFSLFGGMQSSSPASRQSSWLIGQTLYYNQYIYIDGGSDIMSAPALFRWFGESIGAFLQTPIFGQFSLGGLVFTVICIGLCVLLAKLLS